ncbi:proton-coupled folate transporter-like [Babylonia areolata]|uniref:proton-coupled folate transporter-like n=1 Tax=Babylonia areolata TaxID=304850 RepID=UPI003FD4019D
MKDKERLIAPLTGSGASPYGAINHGVTVVTHHQQHHRTPTASDDDEGKEGQHCHPHRREPQEKHQHHHPQEVPDEQQAKPRPRLCGVVCVQVPAFLFFVSYFNFMPLTQYYMTDRLYKELGVPNVTGGCSDEEAGGGSSSGLADRIQDQVSTYTMVLGFVTNFPAVLPALFMGSLSDRFGRKAVLYLVVVGVSIRMTITALVFHFSWRVEYLYIGGVVEGLTGSFGSFLMSTYAIVADVTKDRQARRGLQIALTEAATMLGNSAGSVLSGYWLKLGYVPPVLFSVGLQVVVLVFFIVLIPETVTRSGETTPINCSVLLRSVRVFLQRGRRCFLLTCLVVFFLGIFSVAGNVMILLLYLLNFPFCWSEVHISAYNGVNTVISWIIVLSVTAWLGKRVADDTFALAGAMSATAGFILQGLSKSDLLMYLAAGASLLSRMTWPMMRTMMSKRVDAHEQGAVFAGIAVIEMLGTTAGSVISPFIYKASLGHVHGLPFLCFAAVEVVVALCLISLIVRRKRHATNQMKQRGRAVHVQHE